MFFSSFFFTALCSCFVAIYIWRLLISFEPRELRGEGRFGTTGSSHRVSAYGASSSSPGRSRSKRKPAHHVAARNRHSQARREKKVPRASITYVFQGPGAGADLALVLHLGAFSRQGAANHVNTDVSQPFTKPCKIQQKCSDGRPNCKFPMCFTAFSERRAKHANSDGLRPCPKPCKKQQKRSDRGPIEQFSLRFTTFSERRAKRANSDGLRPFTKPCKNCAKCRI